jgi:hypothetical protein
MVLTAGSNPPGGIGAKNTMSKIPHRKPPQGAHSIESQQRKARIKAAAGHMVDGVLAYAQLSRDPDFERIAQSTPDPVAYRSMVEKYGREQVSAAYKFWRQTER